MKFEDVMNLILPPVGGVRSHITIPSGDYRAGEAQGRRYPSKIPHRGVDMSYIGGQTAKINQSHPDVHSPVSGKVTGVGEGKTKAITIKDANNFIHQILHTQTQSVIENQEVFAGDKIGAMGNSGTQDQHVQYQIKDPKGNSVNPHAFWNQYLSEYQRYLDAIGTNGSGNTLPGADASSTPSQPGNPQFRAPAATNKPAASRRPAVNEPAAAAHRPVNDPVATRRPAAESAAAWRSATRLQHSAVRHPATTTAGPTAAKR